MINVSSETQNAFKSDNCPKEFVISFPTLNVTISGNNIVENSLKISESIQSGDSLECVGCIASSMQVKVYGLTDQVIKDTKVVVSVKVKKTNETIKLFTGYVDSAKKEVNRKFKTIKAYDYLYTLNERDITDWYNGLGSRTLSNLMREVCDYVSLPYDRTTFDSMVNGSVATLTTGDTNRKVRDLTALKLLKSICQINGCFGQINREGKFIVKYLKTISAEDKSKDFYLAYPNDDIYPSSTKMYPGFLFKDNYITSTEKVEYEDFDVKPIERVVFRENLNDDYLGSYGSGTNKYIIQGNMFAYDRSTETLNNLAKKIYDAICNISYTPFTSKHNCLPYLECGDNVTYTDITYNPEQNPNNHVTFYIFERDMSGDVFMRDTYESQGDQYQKEFVTDVSTSLEELRNETADSNYNYDSDISDLDGRVTTLENAEPVVVPEHIWLVSKDYLPPNWAFTDNVYFIGGKPLT